VLPSLIGRTTQLAALRDALDLEIERMTTHVIATGAGRAILHGFVVFKLSGGDTGGSFSIVEHTLQPGMLGAPIHTHQNEDEYSYVLEGEMTALIGRELVHAPAGALVCKPRHVPHTFWNQGNTALKLLEIIAPAGFERYFDELNELFAMGEPPDIERIVALAQKYGLEMDFASVADLLEKYNLWIGEPPSGRSQ
jgi:mannose-6-phosphate isomerase-like protein (cupin superfamily)